MALSAVILFMIWLESGNTAVLAGDDFASGFYQFRFAAAQFFVAV